MSLPVVRVSSFVFMRSPKTLKLAHRAARAIATDLILNRGTEIVASLGNGPSELGSFAPTSRYSRTSVNARAREHE